MKNALKILLMTAVLAPLTIGIASAQSTSLDQLLNQIATLQQQINVLRSQQTAAGAELITRLKEGDRGDQVKILQAILAADSEVYPEGIVSGLFGKLTKAAVNRFQIKTGIHATGTGTVGPLTLKKLNEKLTEMPVALETTAASGVQVCAKVPPGHLIAPGWLRKNGGIAPIVPACQTLPPGIQNLLNQGGPGSHGGNSGTTSPLTILSIGTSGTTSTSTHVIWTTNIPANSRVWYATSSPVAATSTTANGNVMDANNVTFHDLMLSSLTALTTYYYKVSSTAPDSQSVNSAENSFVTLP